MFVCVFVYACVCVCLPVYGRLYVNLFVYMYVRVCVFVCTRGVVVETVSYSIDPVWVYINRKTQIADVSSIYFDRSPLLHSLSCCLSHSVAVYLVYMFSRVTLCFDWHTASLLLPGLFCTPLWLSFFSYPSIFSTLTIVSTVLLTEPSLLCLSTTRLLS